MIATPAEIRDNIDTALALIDGTGAQLQDLKAGHDGIVIIALRDCDSYRRVTAAAGAKTDSGRPLPTPTRCVHDALVGQLVIRHLCWPHLPCWPAETNPTITRKEPE